MQNNIYYRGITIDHSVLALLPTDGDLSNLRTMAVSSSEEEDTPPLLTNEDPHDAHLPSTFLPMPVRGVTEQEDIQQSIDHSGPVSWPSTSENPINEITTEGYMSCAQLPTGAADFLVPRPRLVTIGTYFKHMLHELGTSPKHQR